MNAESHIKIKDLEIIKSVLDKYNINFYIVYGVLLGFYRDGKFLPEDDDIDIAIVDEIDYETKKKIGWELFDLGFVPQNMWFNVFGRMEVQELGYNGDHETGVIVCERNFKFTIFFFKREMCNIHGEEYVCIPKMGCRKLISIPAKFFEKSGIIKIGRNKYKTPYPIKDYLAYSYEDWRDKKKRDHSPLYDEAHKNETVRNT